MRSSQLIRQWQIQKWLEASGIAVSLEELRNGIGLHCSTRTIRRDLQALSVVFDIEHVERRQDGESAWSLYAFKGVKAGIQAYHPLKRCMQCLQEKDRETEFWKDKKQADGYNRRCSTCTRIRKPERVRYELQYYRKHRERVLHQRRERWREDRVARGFTYTPMPSKRKRRNAKQ